MVYTGAAIGHLFLPEKLLSITPPGVPFASHVIFLTGIFEIAASIALVTRPLRWSAGVTMAVYALCVWPANFKHALEGADIPYLANSWLYHGPRLALQPVIIWWALYCAEAIDWPWRK